MRRRSEDFQNSIILRFELERPKDAPPFWRGEVEWREDDRCAPVAEEIVFRGAFQSYEQLLTIIEKRLLELSGVPLARAHRE